MNRLNPCIEDESQCDSEELKQERADTLAYRAWLTKGQAADAPFATLVALHNLVSSSVDKDWVRNGVRQYACAKDAAEALQPVLGFSFEPRTPAPPSGSLPGLDTHHLINCS